MNIASAIVAVTGLLFPQGSDLADNIRPSGSLTGASIFLSPGHGWWHNGTAWTTQRGLTHGVIEDHSNAETVIQYLVPFLENAGARVYMARERDMQTKMAIVESDAAGLFLPDIPESGYYAVYLWYDFAETEAIVDLRHTGGSTAWRQRLDHDFGTWTYGGTYWFDEGENPATGSVAVDVPDAVSRVRFGGGMGDFAVEGETSGKPRWEESGLYYTRFAGFDPAVTGADRRWNQVHAMPRWAEWEMETWEAGRSIYLSWHTNGSYDHEISGISSYIYSVWAWGPPESFHGFPGSRELAEHVHSEVLHGVRAGWDSAWDDVGIVGRWLGETNPSSNNAMPAMLLENGFHDNPHDAAYILEPEFRRLAAHAAYRGIVGYYHAEVPGFDSAVIAPDPPTHLRVRANPDGRATVSWQAPPSDTGDGLLGDAADRYRVHFSRNGKGFDDGTPVGGTKFVIADLAPGETRFVRVTAVNEGGESFPTETLCVSVPGETGGERVLIVNGFDRLDRGLNFIGPDGEERGILARMNSRDYCIQHAAALSSGAYVFDSTSDEAVLDGDVALAEYDAVVWMFGREESTFDDEGQRLVGDYVRGGGVLVVSGAHIASDLDRTPEGQAFLRDVLGAELVRPDSRTRTVEIALPGTRMGGEFQLSGTGNGPYELREADVLAPASGAEPLLQWRGIEHPASAAIASTGERDVLYFAFPIECMLDTAVRDALVTGFLDDVLK